MRAGSKREGGSKEEGGVKESVTTEFELLIMVYYNESGFKSSLLTLKGKFIYGKLHETSIWDFFHPPALTLCAH